MTRIVYYSIGGTLLLAVVIALFLLYKSIEDSSVSTEYEVASLEIGQSEKKRDFGWLQLLSDVGSRSYTLPVDEINIRLSLSELPQPVQVTQIVARNVDQYQYFCIQQIFAKHQIRYSELKRDQSFVANLIDVDTQMLQRLQSGLDYYEIDYTVNKFYEKDY